MVELTSPQPTDETSFRDRILTLASLIVDFIFIGQHQHSSHAWRLSLLTIYNAARHGWLHSPAGERFGMLGAYPCVVNAGRIRLLDKVIPRLDP